MPASVRSVLVCAVAALLASLIGLPWPASAVEATTLVAPAAEAIISSPFVIEVMTDADDGEIISEVQAQLAGRSNRSYTLVADAPQDVDGKARWTVTVDPLAVGDILANGPHRVVVRAVPTVGEPPPFAGHMVTLAVPATTPLVAAPQGEDPQQVLLTWDPVDLPDFVAYRVQRRVDGPEGQWATIAAFDDPRFRDAVDGVPAAGRYRYRILVVRGSGSGGEVIGVGAAQGVRADPADPGTFAPPSDPVDQDPASPGDAPPPVEGDAGAGGPVGRPGGGDPSQPSPAPTPGAAPPPPPTTGVAPPPVIGSPPQPPGPAVVPLDDGVFEPLLPVPQGGLGEVVVGETESAFIDGPTREGGTLSVLTEDPVDRNLPVTSAVALLLVLIAAHVRRFLGDGLRG